MNVTHLTSASLTSASLTPEPLPPFSFQVKRLRRRMGAIEHEMRMLKETRAADLQSVPENSSLSQLAITMADQATPPEIQRPKEAGPNHLDFWLAMHTARGAIARDPSQLDKLELNPSNLVDLKLTSQVSCRGSHTVPDRPRHHPVPSPH